MYNIIVYQMGKVASTSLVETLNQFQHVEAYQSHFLGEDNLSKIVTNLVKPGIDEHFIHHGEAQLLKNIGLTRLINRHVNKLEESNLIILSCAREPLDWFRAQLVQEFQGYINGFLQISGLPQDGNNTEEAIKIALKKIQIELSSLIQSSTSPIGEPAFLAELWARREQILNKFGECGESIFHHIITFFRPIYWFDDHIKKNFRVNLWDHKMSDSWFEFSTQNYKLCVFPFESLNKVKKKISALIQLKDIDIKKLNISHEKSYAAFIKQEIEKWKQYPAINKIYKSKYCIFFGYSGKPL